MSKDKRDSEQLTLAQKIEGALNRFFSKHLKATLIVVAAIIVVLIVVGIVMGVNKRTLVGHFDSIDKLERSFHEVSVMDETTDEYQSAYNTLTADLSALAEKSKKHYPGWKANYLLGVIAFDEGRHQDALNYFMDVYAAGSKTYMGSLALANAAACAENLGDDRLALEYWTKIIDEYGFEAAESPKALFGQARLQEKNGETELAKATFQQLADQFPYSEFAKLATNKLAFL